MLSIKRDLRAGKVPARNQSDIGFFFCDYTKDTHCRRLVALIDQYMRDPMGEFDQTAGVHGSELIAGLANHPSSFVLFIQHAGEIVGLATCFVAFSTFKAKQYINIHDIIIDKQYRRKGFGKALMEEIIAIARLRDYCKVNLEVRADNGPAKALYQNLGFHDTEPAMHFWTKFL